MKPAGAITVFLILTLIILVYWLPLRFKLYYSKKDKDDFISVTWQLIPGIWGITAEVPFIKVSPTNLWPVLKIITQVEGEKGRPLAEQEKEITLTKQRIKKLVKKTLYILNRLTEFKNLGKWFLGKITVREFIWYTEIGTKDAANTGILTGVIWGLKSTIYGYFHRMVKKVKKDPRIAVLPDFQQEKALCTMICIFDISCGHIIIGGFKALSIFILKKKRR